WAHAPEARTMNTTRTLALLVVTASIGSAGAQAPQGGSFRVVNQSAEALRILVDGRDCGFAPPLQTHTFFNLAAGYRSALVLSAVNQVRARMNFALAPGAVFTWTAPGVALAPSPAFVQVRNQFPVPARV